MLHVHSLAHHLEVVTDTLMAVLPDAVRFLALCLRPAPALAAENLFLRKQLAQYQERQVKPRRANNATRIALVWLSRFFDWHRALVIVQPGVSRMGLHVIKTPVRTPVANAICERIIGTLRRECLDFVIPLNETHLYSILKEWVSHYNQSRPHMSLGPGIPKPIRSLPVSRQKHRHGLRSDQCVVSQPVLSGLHQDYRLEKKAA